MHSESNQPPVLSRQEVEQLTDKRTAPAMERSLKRMGAYFIPRPGSFPYVLRTELDRLQGVRTIPQIATIENPQPRFEALSLPLRRLGRAR